MQAEVFQRAAEADEELALVVINGGQYPRRVGQDGNAIGGSVKTPGLAVVSGRRPGGGCDQLAENGVVDVHGASLWLPPLRAFLGLARIVALPARQFGEDVRLDDAVQFRRRHEDFRCA